MPLQPYCAPAHPLSDCFLMFQTQTRDLLLLLMLIYLAIVLLFCTLTAHTSLPFRTVQLVRRAGRG